MKSNYKQLGRYISEVNIKNTNLEVDLLLGVSITKKFIPSIANTIGTDMSKYKIVRKNQFGYGPITSRNGDKISVALLTEKQCIISTSYRVFEINDHKELDPEYLMMWFRRPEFDRYARFMSHGSTREAFDWDEMCETELPIPSIDKQRKIVEEYNTIVNRIKLNEKLNQKLEETAQALYKHWFVDFEFPNENGQPYKSSGGEMVYNEELDQEIPEGWSNASIKDFGKIVTGTTPSSNYPEHFGEAIPFVTPTDFRNYEKFVIGAIRKLSNEGVDFLKSRLLPTGSIIVTCIGSDMGKVIVNKEPCITNQQINSIILNDPRMVDFLYNHLIELHEYLRNIATGSSTMLMINKTEFEIIQILKPSEERCFKFHEILRPINENIFINAKMSQKLKKMKVLILSKMSKVEFLQTEQAI